MFLDAVGKISSSMVSFPIATFTDQTGNIISSIGVGVPASVVGSMGKAGIVSHDLAEKLSKALFERNGPTLTGKWMDASGPFKEMFPSGVQGGWHRIHGHHFITDAIKVLGHKDLKIVDFFSHLATDIVTKNGITILPGELVRSLASVLGISPNSIMPWISMNMLDVASTTLAVFHAGSNVLSVVSGSSEWGIGYAVDTLGLGVAEIVGGAVTKNPILIGAGVADVACGTITAYDHYTQPFFCGVPVYDILQASSVGVALAAVLTGAEIFLSKKSQSSSEKIALICERVSVAGVLSALSVVSAPVSITAGIGISGFKLAKSVALKNNDSIRLMPISGSFSSEIDKCIVRESGNQEAFNKMKDYLR